MRISALWKGGMTCRSLSIALPPVAKPHGGPVGARPPRPTFEFIFRFLVFPMQVFQVYFASIASYFPAPLDFYFLASPQLAPKYIDSVIL